MVHGAEPLGKGRYRFRLINRSQGITVPELGSGNAYTALQSLAYGITSGIQASVTIPFLLDAAGGLNKYGTGDPVIGIKYSRPSRLPAGFYSAYQLLVGLPLGYKGEHGLDDYDGGVRPFSNQSVDLGLNVLLDMHFRYLSLYLNGGYLRSGNPEVMPELTYGIGLELLRRNRWLSLNGEYSMRVAFAEESRGAGAVKLGTRVNVFRGVQLELNREYGFLDHPADALFTFGVRTHGFLLGRRRLEHRYALYRPPAPPRRLYEPDQVLKIAVVDFAGFEEVQAGRRLVEKLRERLAPHDSLEVVDLKRYADIPHRGFLRPTEALDLARKLNVDVVVTGEVADYEVSRFGGHLIPFVVRLPEARVDVSLRYRVLEFSQDKTEMQAFLDEVAGHSRLMKRVQLLPPDSRDITTSASARELHEAQDRALHDLAGKMLASMAAQFSWVPPNFLP